MTDQELKDLLANPEMKQLIRNLLDKKAPPVAEKKKEVRAATPSYSLEIISHCNLCHSNVYRLYNMYKHKGGFVSVSVPNRSLMVEPRRRQVLAVANCPNCKHELQKRDKQWLIDKLVKSRTCVIQEYWAALWEAKELMREEENYL